MTAQLREDIRPLKDSCNSKNVWIIGSGTTLDNHDLSPLKKEYIFALNSASTLLKNKGYTNFWWVWWDIRVYRECWPHLSDIDMMRCIIHKRGLEMMRSHRGPGRYVCYNAEEYFKPGRSVIETALVLANFIGFDNAILVGIDGMLPDSKNRPYCKEINKWKHCFFMKKGQPPNISKSSGAFVESLGELFTDARRVKRLKVWQCSDIFPDKTFDLRPQGGHLQLEKISFEDALGKFRNGSRKKIPVSSRTRQSL